MKQRDPPNNAQLTAAINALLEVLNADSDEERHRIQSGAMFVDAFIVFDEAL